MIGMVRLVACACALVFGVTIVGCSEHSTDAARVENANADVVAATPSAAPVPAVGQVAREADPPQVASEPVPAQAVPAEKKPETKKIIVYYFHRTLRCKTCLAIESQAKTAVEGDFASALKLGRIAWRVVDIDQAANKHFEQDFKLESSSVVVVETLDGQVSKWKNLPLVWDLVLKKEAFRKYVSGEVALYLH